MWDGENAWSKHGPSMVQAHGGHQPQAKVMRSVCLAAGSTQAREDGQTLSPPKDQSPTPALSIPPSLHPRHSSSVPSIFLIFYQFNSPLSIYYTLAIILFSTFLQLLSPCHEILVIHVILLDITFNLIFVFRLYII